VEETAREIQSAPVSSWDDPDEAWTDVARGIREVVEELRKRSK
jgi:hypothetical protein